MIYRSATKGLLMNSGWRPKRSFIGQINDFWTSITNVFPQNRTFWRQKKLLAVARVMNLWTYGNWLGPVMDLFGKLLDLSLENNAFPAALMDLFQKNSSRLIKLIVTAHPNLSWHYGMSFPKFSSWSKKDILTMTNRAEHHLRYLAIYLCIVIDNIGPT